MKAWAAYWPVLALAWWSPQRLRRALVGAIAVLLCLTIAELAWPSAHAGSNSLVVPVAGPLRIGPASREARDWTAIIQRRSLFEPAVPLPSRNVARQSVDKVLAQLTLNATMRDGETPVAFIRVKGYGLKKFREGEGIEEMFKVIRIEGGSVELQVAGERMKLGQ